MGLEDVKALTFDTGGTILDWHTGFRTALAETGVPITARPSPSVYATE